MTHDFTPDELRHEAQFYLRQPEKGFWRWSDELDAVEWQTGKTIVFRGELAEILEPIAQQGLPGFGAILLLIAATRESWTDVSQPGSGQGLLAPKELLSQVARNKHISALRHADEIFDGVVGGLNVVHGLDNDVKLSVPARQTLVSLVFEDGRGNQSPDVSLEVVNLLKSYPEAICIEPGRRSYSLAHPPHGSDALWHNMRELRDGLTRVSNEVLRTRRRTGLIALPEPVAEDLIEPDHPSSMVTELLKQLDQDVEFCGIAKAARQLSSVMSLPKPVSLRDDLALGGVSDISNRGPLDRLLLTELAHDDLTLAVRVAVNEAMYLRRESPPRSTTRHRIIVVDTGIRMWGVPRALATALALAMVVNSDEQVELATYCTTDNGLLASDLTTKKGLEGQLSELSVELHPGRSLVELKRVCDQFERDQDSRDSIDVVLITSPAIFNDFELTSRLNELQLLPIHVATTERDGQTRLFEVTGQGRRELKHAQIELDVILRSRPGQQKLIDKQLSEQAGLPLIFGVTPFPLLMSHASNRKRAWPLGSEGALAITADHQLCFWRDRDHGGLIVANDVEPGQIHWYSKQRFDGRWYAIVGRNREGCFNLLTFDPDSNEFQRREFFVENVIGFVSHRDSIFALTDRKIIKLNLSQLSDLSATVMVPSHVHWVYDRFFKSKDHWYALSVDDNLAHFEQLPQTDDEFESVFECVGIEGPIGITKRGCFYYFGSDQLRLVDDSHIAVLKTDANRVKVLDIANDGAKVLLGSYGEREYVNRRRVEVDVVNCKTKPININVVFDKRNTVKFLRERAVRKKFNSLSILQYDGEHEPWMRVSGRDDFNALSGCILSIQSFKQSRIDFICNGRMLRMAQIRGNGKVLARKSFQLMDEPVGHVGLSRIEWEDGSLAYLDSRGILHLKSSNSSVPQLAIVLTGEGVAGWRSDGCWFGDPYFYDSEVTRTLSIEEVYETIQQYLLEIKLGLSGNA